MKKTLSIILAMSLVLSAFSGISALAEEASLEAATQSSEELSVPATEQVEYSLSLSDAVDMALKDNPQLVANECNQTANKINIKSAVSTKSSMKKASKLASQYGILSATTIDEICVRKGYYVNAMQTQYDLSVMERERIVASINYNVTNAYYNVLLMDMLVGAAKNSYSMALENKAVIDAQYGQGLVPQMAYDNASISVDGALSKLEAYELSRDIAMRNLKNCIKLPYDSIVYLTDSITTEDFISDVDTDVQNALETRYDVISLKKMYELSEEYFDCADAFTEGSAVYNTAYADMVNKKYQYDTAKDGIELAIRTSYNSIISNHAAMGISERTRDMAKREYEAARLQYELGMITNLELTDKIYSLYEAEVSYSQSKINYTMAVEKYKYDITIGLPQ